MRINSFVPDIGVFNETSSNQGESSTGVSFSDTLKSKLDEVNDKQIEANVLTDKLVKGEGGVDIHQVMLSTEEAKMSLQLAVQMRNKLLEAYQELNRMQL